MLLIQARGILIYAVRGKLRYFRSFSLYVLVLFNFCLLYYISCVHFISHCRKQLYLDTLTNFFLNVNSPSEICRLFNSRANEIYFFQIARGIQITSTNRSHIEWLHVGSCCVANSSRSIVPRDKRLRGRFGSHAPSKDRLPPLCNA